MLTDDTPLDQFLVWLKAIDPSSLLNEAEVESKFVVPLFHHLGYPEACRHPQYPVNKLYEPGARKRGRKPSIDQIYFSTSEQKRQNADTSLIIVEAKEPNETHLDEALEQARFYGYHLTPLFLVVTNARRLIVVKRHQYQEEESVFDVMFPQLQEQTTAKQLYQQLHFETVKQLKEHLADDLTHARSVDLLHTLERYPDIHNQLVKGDFQPSRTQEGRHLTVIKPKVAVVCDLPLTFGDGACSITFSNLLLRGLTCHLTHQQILESLMTGLETPPDWRTRRFLKQTEKGVFEAQLGQTTVSLSKQEAEELCACIDDVCLAYKAILVTTEETLQTWEYLPVSLAGFQMHGFALLTVEPWLWKLMVRFAREFDFLQGTSSWHIFDPRGDQLRVLSSRNEKYDENVLMRPFYGPSAFPKETVDILYCVEDWDIAYMERVEHLSWQQMVGPHGRWSAEYTEHWLVNQFIPHVLTHYPLRKGFLGHRKRTRRTSYWTGRSLSEWHMSLAQVSTPAQLAPYVRQVQEWFHIYGDCQIATSLLRPYYTALTDVVRRIDASQLGSQYFGYIGGYVFGAAQRANKRSFQIAEEEENPTHEEGGDESRQENETVSPSQMMHEIIEGLDGHARRIYHVEHESSDVADFVSSALIALLEHGTIHCRQDHLNAAREALLPLLDLSRFEERYILRPPYE